MSEINWIAIRTRWLVCRSIKQVADEFGVPANSVKTRSRRENWAAARSASPSEPTCEPLAEPDEPAKPVVEPIVSAPAATTSNPPPNQLKLLRWTVEQAAAEFNISPRTLIKQLKALSILPSASDKRWSTAQMVAAIFGDIEAQKLRNLTLDARLKEIEIAEKERHLIPADLVIAAVEDDYTSIRRIIDSDPELSDNAKARILGSLETRPIDAYFVTAAEVDDESDVSELTK